MVVQDHMIFSFPRWIFTSARRTVYHTPATCCQCGWACPWSSSSSCSSLGAFHHSLPSCKITDGSLHLVSLAYKVPQLSGLLGSFIQSFSSTPNEPLCSRPFIVAKIQFQVPQSNFPLAVHQKFNSEGPTVWHKELNIFQ